jgi:hypothetical protein
MNIDPTGAGDRGDANPAIGGPPLSPKATDVERESDAEALGRSKRERLRPASVQSCCEGQSLSAKLGKIVNSDPCATVAAFFGVGLLLGLSCGRR